MSRSTYDELAAIFKKAGKKIPTFADEFPTAKKVVSNGELWKELPTKRGFLADNLLGNNLGRTYETYDHFDDLSLKATSFKTVDPMCKSYQTRSKFKGVLNKYKNDLLRGKWEVVYKNKPYSIKKKCLEIAFPDVPFTTMQKEVLNDFISDNADKFDIIITVIK
jgi:hypothetical protein